MWQQKSNLLRFLILRACPQHHQESTVQSAGLSINLRIYKTIIQMVTAAQIILISRKMIDIAV